MRLIRFSALVVASVLMSSRPAVADWLDNLIYPPPPKVPKEFNDRYSADVSARVRSARDIGVVCAEWVQAFSAGGYLSKDPNSYSGKLTAQDVLSDCEERGEQALDKFLQAERRAEVERSRQKYEDEQIALTARLAEERKAAAVAAIPAALDLLLSGEVDTAYAACFSVISMKNRDDDSTTVCREAVDSQYREGLKKQAPKSCPQWAIMNGPQWENAGIDMKAGALDVSREPVAFVGEVTDAESGVLAVYNKADGSNAQIVVGRDSAVVGRRIVVGGRVRGLGLQTETVSATLVSGQKTRIPIIRARCVEGR